ncbi:MAG: secondary thiamine-phosphate synthase enzyme YjbQ [Thermodesulfobacteriota bacterium]|nr:secondary thiamine-phosphate synthase enzyme YjbQ [Thermodesulfobacteriota bacterium]
MAILINIAVRETMAVVTREVAIRTSGFNEIHDITSHVEDFVRILPFDEGAVTIFVPGSTAGVTTIEFESGAVNDLKDAFERLIPQTVEYKHDLRWGDGNGFSHVRSAICKVSLTVPFTSRRLLLGTWQQIVLIDFDNRKRKRVVIFQAVG